MKDSVIIPTTRYHDAAAAIEWLCDAFGFVRHLVVPGEGETIAHAQLRFGNSMIMLGSARADEFGKFLVPPEDRLCTRSVYIFVPDAYVHYRRSVAAGTEIIMDIEEQEYGGKLYTCRDPQGQIWSFGSYDPWDQQKEG